MRRLLIACAPVLLALPAAAHAQAIACAIPATLPRPEAEGPTAQNPRRDLPIGSYTLALSWSPGHCYGKADAAKDAFQCGGEAGRFGFVLHGLWPDGVGREWPQYCRPAAPLAEPVIRSMLCDTPSVQLIQHEWAKHGTCTGLTPQAYFATATRRYRALRFPDLAKMARQPDLTAGSFAAAFAALNRGMTADAVRVTVNRSGWLDELWLCLDKRLRYAKCAADSGGVPRSTRLKITAPG